MRLLWLLLALLVGMVGVSRLFRPNSGAVSVAPRPPASALRRPVVPGGLDQPITAPRLATAPEPTTLTPVIERLARAEWRRRIGWAGRAVYLDSAFAGSDSTLRRWNERAELRVAVVPPSGNPALVAEVQAAVREWRSAGHGMVLTDVVDTTGADVVVQWVERFEPEEGSPAGESVGRTGLTQMEWNGHGEAQRASVTLAMAQRSGRPLEPAEIRAIAMHELGHALGLPHSGDSGDIMYPTVRRPTLSARDRATVALLYSLPPGSLREPATP